MPINSPTRIRKRSLALVIALALTLALAACGSSSGGSSKASSSTADITIKNIAFPPTTTVAAGSTVTVQNDDTVTHTVTSNDGTSFNITVNPGKSATFTAPAAGTYKYHCNIHSQMHGTLTVT
jgi:plastocyanin